MIQPFLHQVARAFADTPPADLASHCFVFPNKRSATFFRHYLRQVVAGKGGDAVPYIEPEFIDISSFVARFSTLAEASRYESLFTLYNCYRQINSSIRGVDLSFDRFLFWGEMLISDFNDVDRYLVNPDHLFTNIRRLKEIGSTYLTPEQIEIIRRYWGADAGQLIDETHRFWTHIDNNKSKSAPRFKQLWEVLGPLYHSYISELEKKGLTTNGRLYRIAAESSGIPPAINGASKISFIGFNVLTTAELKLFRKLKAAAVASFFWDFNSPALKAVDNKAGRFIRKNMEEFPPPENFFEEPITTFPKIDIIGVPSNVGQTKMASDVISRWSAEGLVDTSPGAINTAVVLPDEALFIPMVHSMPSSVTDMNITMGFPMRYSPVAAVMNSIFTMQRNARRKGGRVVSYFFDDIRHLLSMPLIQSISPRTAADVETLIRQKRIYHFDLPSIQQVAAELMPLFQPLPNNASADQSLDYIKSITAFLSASLSDLDIMQQCQLRSYDDAVDSLVAAMHESDISMDAFTFLSLVSRAVRRDAVSFVGEPLRGLQVMGMLETRALDFENIVILSMNERIFPRKHYSRSFIPDLLRRAFGMATTDFQESIFAYYFYRLISRASRVSLIYDSRSVGGVRSSEMSRYITQLLYLFPEARARLIGAQLSRPSISSGITSVKKTPAVMDRLLNYTRPDSNWNLSASSINTYIDCPLKFYLQYVERYNPDQEITDYVDYGTYGNIVHEVMEKLYKIPMVDGRPAIITQAFINKTIHPSDTTLDKLIHAAINRNFNKINEPDQYRDLVGETLILGRIIKANIVDLLKIERDLWTPFTIIDTERRVYYKLPVNNSLTVNIKQIIDRIDAISDPDAPSGQRIRIVDYKTGSDDLSTTSVDRMFLPSDKRPKAMAQLLFYCHVYSLREKLNEPIQPLIIKMQKIYEGITPLKIDRTPILDYRTLIDEYLGHFNRVVEDIFNPEIPFLPAVNDHACKFCNFKSLCSRQ